jgi:hypothetical protein
MESVVKFEAGNIYQMNFIGDSELKPKYICVRVTEKTVSFERFNNAADKVTRKIKTFRGVQYVVDGSYSMAPSIYADKVVG